MPGMLIAHAGGELMTREQLRAIPTPAPTDTWKPIPFFDLVQALDRQLMVRNIHVVKEEFAVAREGMRLFGVLEVNVPTTNGFGFVIGVRTSNDKHFPTSLIAGARVFVCDNLAFNGDFVAMKRKHTANFDLNSDMSRAVDRYQHHLVTFGRKFEGLKERRLNPLAAKAMIFDALEQDIVPPRAFPAVLEGFRKHEGDLTAYSVHNVITGAFKQLSPAALFESTAQLGKLFGLTAY